MSPTRWKRKTEGTYTGKSISHTHESQKYNPCRTVEKEYYGSFVESRKKTSESLVQNNRSPYAVNFDSIPFGHIRIPQDVLGQYKEYTAQHVINFFSHIDEVSQVDVLHKLDQPLLRFRFGKRWLEQLPVQLFWEGLHSHIKKDFPDHTNLVRNVRILFSACGKTFNFTI